MWNRQVLKAKGKAAFRANYWKSVLVAFLATLATGSASSLSSRSGVEDIDEWQNIGDGASSFFSNLSNGQILALLGVTAGVAFVAIAIGIAVSILVLNPLCVGTSYFFLQNRTNPGTELGTLERGFKQSYKNIVYVQFMKNLFIILWTLLLVIPGLIKNYQYMLVKYMLAENPDMECNQALEESKRLMHGQKWNAFVLDLSFIGWFLLGSISFGIVNLLYTQPFIEATHAELYMALVHPGESSQVNFTEKSVDDSQTVEFVVEEK